MNWSLDPREWFNSKDKKPAGKVGLAVSEYGVAISHAAMENGQFKVLKLEFAPITDPAEIIEHVKNWVNEHQLKNADCHYVLDKKDYELELVEAPQVEDNELLSAVRFRLKDLIAIPSDEAIIDIFPLPSDAYRGRMKMLYVVATRRDIILDTVKLIRSCGLNPNVIDIEEMAIRNIALYLPDIENSSIALLKLNEHNGGIYMFSDEDMYLSRAIETGFAGLLEETRTQVEGEHGFVMEGFILDVQRSLDYYESQLGKGMANKVYLLPTGVKELAIEAPMQRLLTPQISELNTKNIIPMGENITFHLSDEMHLLPVIGAVLRRPT